MVTCQEKYQRKRSLAEQLNNKALQTSQSKTGVVDGNDTDDDSSEIAGD